MAAVPWNVVIIVKTLPSVQDLQKCEQENVAVYDLLRTGMVDELPQEFAKYHEKNIKSIRSKLCGEIWQKAS